MNPETHTALQYELKHKDTEKIPSLLFSHKNLI